MKNITLLILAFLTIFSYVSRTMGEESKMCEKFDGTRESLYACGGKIIKFLVKRSEHIEQHPVGLLNKFDPQTNKIVRKYETYVEILDTEWQVVLTSTTPIECASKIEGRGRVRVIKPKSSTEVGKNSYQRPWVDVLEFKCVQ